MKHLIREALDIAPKFAPALSMEEEIITLADAEGDRLEAIAQLEEAERSLDITDALEDLAFVADTITSATPREAALIQIISNTATAGTGVDGSVIAPALEDGEKAEGSKIRQVIAKIVNAIKEAVAKVWEYIKSFFAKILPAAASVKERLDNIKERVKETRDNPNAAKISGVLPFVGTKELKTTNDIARELGKFEEQISEFVDEHEQYANGLGTSIIGFYQATGDAKATGLLKFVAGAYAATAKPGRVVRIQAKEGQVEGTTNAINGTTFHRKGLQFNTKKPITDDGDFAGVTSLLAELSKGATFTAYQAQTDGVKEATIPAFSVNDIAQIAEHLDDLIEHLSEESSKVSLAKAAKARLDYSKTLSEHLVKSVSGYKDDTPGAEEFAGASPRLSTFFTQQSTTPYTYLSSQVLRVMNQVIALLNRSLNSHHFTKAK